MHTWRTQKKWIHKLLLVILLHNLHLCSLNFVIFISYLHKKMLENYVQFYIKEKGKPRAELETVSIDPTSLLPLCKPVYKAVPVILGKSVHTISLF